MEEYNITNVAAGVDIIKIPCNDFKTNIISASLAVPLEYSAAAENALVIMLLSRRCRQFDTIEKLNRRLAYLYGAVLRASSTKLGENQILKLEITALDNRFSIDNENISNECIELLLSLIFEPCLSGGIFSAADVEREKRLLIEKIESRENEKRLYALDRAVEIMFQGEPYAVNPLGTRAQIKEITPQAAFEAYRKILQNARVLFTAVGNIDVERAALMLKDRFAAVARNYLTVQNSVIKSGVQKARYEDERINIKQGKLILGFRAGIAAESPMASAMAVFTDIFGGGPYSKLFLNVREKMSLCYYCSALYDRRKGFIAVQCGCEEENTQKAVNEILNQLEIIKSGDFDVEFQSSKISLINSYASVSDTPEGLAAWYSQQIADEKIKTPAQKRAEIERVSKNEIIKCANYVKLDTVFRLLSTGGAQS
ncbi:MAG: insulinase family protein [Clostridiales bacterium]|nr:insulinase family protein [Clostridiales bacterium]